jgi:uncharacterized protein (DUF2235 family)
MPKNIVFCADGTWQDPNDNSNVCQLYNALAKVDGVQYTSYDSGVGAAGGLLDKLLGGAFGVGGDGLFDKIKDGYADVCAHYQPGDQLFLFGFSRGAYTARCLAGMIAICGLPTVNQGDPKVVDMAFEAYRNTEQRPALLDTLNQTYTMDDAKLQLVGVWDTVGSLGVPAIFGGTDANQFGFLSTTLHPDVLNAVQALSIDEERQQFQPCLWDGPVSDQQSLTQVWFAGVHCDVGGGYKPDADGSILANVTLRWMAQYANNFGLVFNPGAFANLTLPSPAGMALATLHNSRTPPFGVLPAFTRNIVASSAVASSVNTRLRHPDLAYTPSNLHVVSGQLSASYNLVNV